MDTPKILYFDIETSISIFAGYSLGKQHIRHTQVLKRPQVMCISWAWNDKKVQHDTFDLSKYKITEKDDNADFELLKKFSKILIEADLIVGQNSKNFDLATLMSRIIKYKLPPLPPILHDDMYAMTNKTVGHLSHKLDDVGDFLGYGGKEEHGNSMEWWIAVSQGSKKHLNRMVTYCDKDVILLRETYKHQLPYLKSSLNFSSYSGEVCCSNPLCRSKDLERRGYRRTTVGKFQRYQCKKCGAWTSDGKNLISTPKNLPR